MINIQLTQDGLNWSAEVVDPPSGVQNHVAVSTTAHGAIYGIADRMRADAEDVAEKGISPADQLGKVETALMELPQHIRRQIESVLEIVGMEP